MKISITGATGFIGAITLNKALEHPSITKVIAYTRRPLQPHAKLENILTDTRELPQDDSPLIWCAGVKLGVTLEDAKRLEDAALTAAAQRSRFVYLSGMLAVKDQKQSTWFAGDARKLKGKTETRLSGEEQYIARPSMVTREWSLPMTIRVDDLAAVLVELAVNGNKKKVWENGEMVTFAKTLKTKSA